MSDIIQNCSINGKRCCNGIREDFTGVHPVTNEKLKCNEWVSIRGEHPQTGDPVEHWMCAKFAMVLALVENSGETRKVAAEIEKHTNVFVQALPPPAANRVMEKYGQNGNALPSVK